MTIARCVPAISLSFWEGGTGVAWLFSRLREKFLVIRAGLTLENFRSFPPGSGKIWKFEAPFLATCRPADSAEISQ
jgi:hypothetical protein